VRGWLNDKAWPPVSRQLQLANWLKSSTVGKMWDGQVCPSLSCLGGGGDECSRRWQSVTVVVAACSFVLELVEEL
jgi:hypothetical protein